MKYNERKLVVLDAVCKLGEATPDEVCDYLNGRSRKWVELSAIQMALLRYHLQGLLSRGRYHRQFYYELTDRGLKKLASGKAKRIQ